MKYPDDQRDLILEKILTLLSEERCPDTELERALGLSAKTVSNWRRGISHSYMRRLPEIAAWLRGSGTVTFANRQGGFYHARVVNQIPFEKVLRCHPHRSFAVTFRCQPFFHLKADDITVTAPGTFIANPGCIASEPVVRVTLSGDAEITIGGYLFLLTDVTGTVTIDTPRLECYQVYTSRNACMAGDYPKIPAVGAYVSWVGDVSRIVISPNWRTL